MEKTVVRRSSDAADAVESAPIPASLQMANDVERDLREQQVGVFFVMPRVVRRVLQSELDITSPWQPPPHRKCCVVARDRLLWVVARDELGVDANAKLPEQLILIAQPEEEQLATMTRQELQRHYWRLMFHARIDYAMMTRTRRDRMSIGELRQQIDRLGQTAFDEIRSVLRAEQMLFRPDDDRHVYAEFVAVYHELSAFAPRLVPIYFPSLGSPKEVLSVIGLECNAAELLNSTRPQELDVEAATNSDLVAAHLSTARQSQRIVRKRSARKFATLLRSAEALGNQGNNVRAALVFQIASEVAPEDKIAEAQERLKGEIQKLVGRLQTALQLREEVAYPWLAMCEKLIPGAQRGFWNANVRLLYDLQKACFDNEHETYKIDLLRWTLSLGKSRLKRPLSNQRVVLVSKHLRAATLRVPDVEIDSDDRGELNELLNEAAAAAEHILRIKLSPLIETALLDAGFIPASVVERVSLKKMVQELTDDIVERGFITLGGLRDTVSRNRLKMTDLKSVEEFFAGDPLLRADRLLSASLEGVYPRGPIYLRWLQKANSLAYGIPWGRLFSRYIALPFGLSFLILKTVDVAIDHLHFGSKPASTKMESTAEFTSNHVEVNGTSTVDAVTHAVKTTQHHVDVIYSHRSMVLLALVIFALIQFPLFRRGVVGFLSTAWTVLRGLLIDGPRLILRWRMIDALFKSFPMMLFRRFILAPLTATFVFWWLLPNLGFYGELNFWWGLAIFLAAFLALNSRIGRDTEELAREFFSRTWYRIRVHLLLGLFTLIVDIFHTLMDGLERVLYAVDEWLRFRSGESNFTLGVKAVIGLAWSIIHGVIRFCVTLLIEPQLNPIKHFPVVTVSHKILFATFFFPGCRILEQYFDAATASLITGLTLMGIPGVFGFMAWELKENWKLYKANRSPRLKPVLIGDHGETLLRLLRPGFHSGTIPRLFANRRRAARRESETATVGKQAKFVTRLHHESIAVEHFIERELIALLSESRTFGNRHLSVRNVELTTNRVLVTIQELSMPERPLKLEFAEQSGWIVGVMRESGWLNQLPSDEIQVFKSAVTGLYKLAAVDLVREQIQGQLMRGSNPVNNVSAGDSARMAHAYDIDQQGLVIWPNGNYDVEVHYPLDEDPITHPRPRSVARAYDLPPMALEALVFMRHDIQWDEWQSYWENEQTNTAPAEAVSAFNWSISS